MIQTVSRRLLALTALVVLLGFATVVHAQEQQSRITLSVSPQKLELGANPGDTLTETVRITNGSAGAVVIDTNAKDFSAAGEEGEVQLQEQDNSTFSLASWVSISPSEATIAASETQHFEITVQVPPDAEPGGHFGAAIFSTRPPEDGSTVARVSQEITTIMLLKVAGDVVESGSIADFSPAKSFWSNEDPITLEARIQNDGNVHFRPSGIVTIKNMFNDEVATINLPENNVLPNAIRRYDIDWRDRGLSIGHYTADLTITYADGEIETTSTSFWVVPYQTLLPIVLGLIAVLFLLIKGRKRLAAAAKAFKG